MKGGRGHCLCGAVTFVFEGAPNWQAHCHCESCRRTCAAPFTSFLGVSHGQWRWSGATPAVYNSSPGVRRHFCAVCGTPMAFEGDRWPHEIHFYAATLDDPAVYEPTAHVNWNEHLPWIALADGLQKVRVPRRLLPSDDMAALLGMITDSFAAMKGRIDPPSSAERLRPSDLARMAAQGEIWIVEDLGRIVGCMILTPEPDCLYLGKLATADGYRRQGIARGLVGHAVARAAELGFRELRLETRIELNDNHVTFRALGFEEVGRTAHPGFDRPTSVTFALRVSGQK